MGLSRRLRNIALSQINAIKERLDRIDAEAAAQEELSPRGRDDARRELDQTLEREQPRLRTPDEIAGRVERRPGSGTAAGPETARQTATARPEEAAGGPLARHYRVLGLADGEDLAAVDSAYAKLAARCAPDRFAPGSEEEAAARQILQRVEAAYNALREALDPTAGRFDKLEI